MGESLPEVPAASVPDDAWLLDVREPEEWTARHAPGATHIPLGELNARGAEIPRDETIYVICRSGIRSARVAMALTGAGWQAVNVAGGMQDWAIAGRPDDQRLRCRADRRLTWPGASLSPARVFEADHRASRSASARTSGRVVEREPRWPNTSRLTVPYSSTQQRRNVCSAPSGRSVRVSSRYLASCSRSDGLELVVGRDGERPATVQVAEQVEEDLAELEAALVRGSSCIHAVLKPGQRAPEDHPELRQMPQASSP